MKTLLALLALSASAFGQIINNSNAAVAAAIAEDPEAVRAAAGIRHIDPVDYGAVYTSSDDTTATANAAALTSAVAAASAAKIPVIIRGTIYIKGKWLVSGDDVNIFGDEAVIIQKDTAHNGMTLDTANPPVRLIVDGVKFSGQGAATHDAAGVHGKKEDNSYFVSDVSFRNCVITAFRRGFDTAGMAKFEATNVSIDHVRYGFEWNHMQTYLLQNIRVTQGDGDSSSACFNVTGGNFFAGKILMGEFGGSGFARLASMSQGILNFEGCNFESFTGSQMVNLTGVSNLKRVEFINCRIAIDTTSPKSFISSEADASGNGLPLVRFERNAGWGGNPRFLEIWGQVSSAQIYSPRVTGPEIKTVYCETQGGTVTTTRYEQQDRQGRVLQANQRGSITAGTDVSVYSYTIPVGMLNRNGQTIKAVIAGTTAANADTKQFKVKVGATTVADFGAIAMNNESWRVEISMMYGAWGGGSGNWKVCSQLFYGSSVITKVSDNTGTVGFSAVAVSLTATTTTSGDVIRLFDKTTAEREADAW